jgi:hypothetical protein
VEVDAWNFGEAAGSMWSSFGSGFSFGDGGEVSSSFATGQLSTTCDGKARRRQGLWRGVIGKREKGQGWSEKLLL